MKKLAVILTVMGFGIYLMLSEKDKKELRKEGEKMKRKLKKTHFPVKEILSHE